MTEQTDDHWFDPDTTTFGDRLAGAREQAGMSQQELAERLGIKPKTLEKWEDDLSEPRANRLSMLAGVLNVSIRWLLTGEGHSPFEQRGALGGYDLQDVRGEIQVLRALMSQTAQHLARLERRLEAALDDFDPAPDTDA